MCVCVGGFSDNLYIRSVETRARFSASALSPPPWGVGGRRKGLQVALMKFPNLTTKAGLLSVAMTLIASCRASAQVAVRRRRQGQSHRAAPAAKQP